MQPTTAAINRDKTDHDPATWTPPQAGRCGYATRYIATKAHYNLSADIQEKKALKRMLRDCSSNVTPSPR